MKINLLKCGKSILTFVLAFSVLAVSLFTGAFTVSADTIVFISDSDLADNGAEDVAAYGAVPSMYQYEYNKQEIGAFLHFSMSTMTDQEIATGDETPSDFTLDEKIDADGYVKAMKDAGFGRIIITTKHHDGFCIWDTEWTEHDIASTNYPGDVLEDLSIACTKYDMDMGIYMSPWDQNSKYYGYYDAEGNSCGWKDDVLNYNDYFVGQLTEILGNDKYGNDGRFVEIWLDPAKNGGEEQWYDYERWIATIRELEGTAAGAEEDPLIFGVGSYDTTVHWIGNERGIANSETWSKLKKDASGTTNGGTANYKGTSTVVGEKYGNLWTVMEADTSIIPGGWFWSEAKKIPKELDDLRDLYCDSVGHGAALLLNIPLNSDGKLDEAISDRTNEWAENIQKSFFDNNLAAAEGVTIYASDVQGDDVRFKPSNVVDGKDDTYWTATQGTKNSSLLIDFGKEVTFDAVVIEEEIYHGQRVEAFTVEYKTPDGIWLEYSSGVTIGSKRVILDRPVTATQVRIDFQGLTDGEQVATPVISHVGIHKATEAFERDGVVWDGSSDTNFAVVDENAEAGTKTNPYIITSPAELYGMVASGGNGKYYKVADGIDKFVLNPVDGMSKEEVIEFFVNASSANQAVTLPPNKWYYYSTWPEAPNDYYKQPFTGHFDGNGATIVGLYGKGDWQAHLGFIPYVENADVTVENVKFQNAYIYSEDTRPEWGSAVVIGNYSTNSATKIKINNVSVVNSTIRDYNAAAIMGYSYITTNVAPRCEISNIVTANNTITCNANSADRHGVVFGLYSFWAGNTTTQLSNMILADNIQFASNAEFIGNSATYSFVSFSNVYTVGTKPNEEYSYAGVTFGVNAVALTDAAAMETASALAWGKDFVAMTDSIPDLAIFHNIESVSVGAEGHVVKCTDEGCAVIASEIVAHTTDESGACSVCGYASSASNVVIWDGDTTDTTFSGGTGGKDDPFIIGNASELYNMVASGGNGAYYRVANGIDKFVLSTDENKHEWYYFSTWADGDYDKKQTFSGHFDGNGVIIEGLYSTSPDNLRHLGFIPCVRNSDVTVQNVKFDSAYISSPTNNDPAMPYGSAVVIGTYETNTANTIKINNVSVVNSSVQDCHVAVLMGYSRVTLSTVAPTTQISNIVTANNTVICNAANPVARYGVVFGYYSFYNGNTKTQLSNMILADNFQFVPDTIYLGKANTFIAVSFNNIYSAGAKPNESYAYRGVSFGVTAQSLTGNTAITTADALAWGKDFVAMKNGYPDLAIFHDMKSVADGEQGHSYKCTDEDCAVIATETVAHNYVRGICSDCGYIHEHNFTTVPEISETCTEEGVKAYRVCSIDICKGLKYDMEEAVVVTDVDLKIAADETVVENHSFGVAQTLISKCDSKENITYKECTECGIFVIGDELVDVLPTIPNHEYDEDGICDCGDQIEVVADSWVQNDDGTRYYFDGNGVMVTGWQQIGGNRYYFDGTGAMQTGWLNDGGTLYYLDTSGAMQTDWQQIDGTWYYFDGSGAMQTDWQQIDGTWYYFDGSGAMQTDWQQIDGTWYYFASSGAMQTGWQQIGGKKYYFDDNGVMQTGWLIISGTWYYFDGNGAMQKSSNEKPQAIEKFTISRNDTIMEGWPDMIRLKSGRILVVYNECTAHGNRNGTHITLRKSDDNGLTWSEKQYIGEETNQGDHWNSIRFSQLSDGRIILICDKISGAEASVNTKFYTFESTDNGDTWTEKYDIGVYGYCSDKIRELSDGSLLLCVSRHNAKISKSEILAHKSYDGGKTWSEPVIVASSSKYTFIEPAALELKNGTIAVFIREDSQRGYNGFISFSNDKGETFANLQELPIMGMHRPTVGFLSDGRILLSYREHIAAGELYPDLKMCIFEEEDLFRLDELELEKYLIDSDNSLVADQGYSAWLQLPDNTLLMANYIVDDAPKAYIRGYRIDLSVMFAGWQQIDGAWYYMNTSGEVITGWLNDGGTWYYFASSGAMRTGWQQVGGTWYYFASSGAMQTGWQQVGGTWYYFASSGAMQTGWQQIGGTWYYMNTSGAMQTGWQQIGGTWYYMYSSGAMATNIYISGGYINASGVWR